MSKKNNNTDNEDVKRAPSDWSDQKTLVPSRVTASSIINDPIDIYTKIPALLKSTSGIHFRTIAVANTSGTLSTNPHLYLNASTDHSYHNAGLAGITHLVYSSTPLQVDDKRWILTCIDFVTKWAGVPHSEYLHFNYYKTIPDGSFMLYQKAMSGTINKFIGVLQLGGSTKTSFTNNPKLLPLKYSSNSLRASKPSRSSGRVTAAH